MAPISLTVFPTAICKVMMLLNYLKVGIGIKLWVYSGEKGLIFIKDI
jgi:hypothetical protein